MSDELRRTLIDPPQKVKLMYQAVIDLINGNRNIDAIKVSDITQQAGIGKGTAYEYFNSKDEIIVKALIYEMMQRLDEVQEILYSDKSFQEVIYCILDIIAVHFHENRTFCTIFKIWMGAYDIPSSMQDIYNEVHHMVHKNHLMRMTDRLIEIGRMEDKIGQQNRLLCTTALNAQIISYVIYIISVTKDDDSSVSLDTVKEFVYQNIIKTLS